MTQQQGVSSYDIFISYRRAGGDVIAKLLYETLRHQKYSVFFDHESLSSGVFGEKIINTVRNAKDVIVVLTKDSLERCKEKDDWMYREISEAIDGDKNMILVFSEDFVRPSPERENDYPENVKKLLSYQGYTVNIEHFDNTLKRICEGLRSEPVFYDENNAHQAVAYLLKSGTESLSNGEKDALVAEILKSRYGTKIADVMSSYLGTNPKYYRNIRLKFNYEITIDSTFNFGSLDVDPDKYFKLSETLSYQKHFLNSSIGDTVWISFVRDLDQVDEFLKNEDYIFSENLLMDESDLALIAELSDEEKMRFFTRNMRVRFNLNGTVLEPAELIVNKTGVFAKYLSCAPELSENPVLDVKIVFSAPQRKVSSYFFASISDPTYSPHISFSYPEDEIEVDMISFMNRNNTTGEAKIFDGLREISVENEWIIPMSGAVFIMNPITEN